MISDRKKQIIIGAIKTSFLSFSKDSVYKAELVTTSEKDSESYGNDILFIEGLDTYKVSFSEKSSKTIQGYKIPIIDITFDFNVFKYVVLTGKESYINNFDGSPNGFLVSYNEGVYKLHEKYNLKGTIEYDQFYNKFNSWGCRVFFPNPKLKDKPIFNGFINNLGMNTLIVLDGVLKRNKNV